MASHPGRVELVAQVGSSRLAAAGRSHALVAPAVLFDEMTSAHAVVCHGGPGTIIDARRAGVEPIVVARDPALGEHVDGHQQRFAAWMAARGQLSPAHDRQELHAALDRALHDRSAYRRVGDAPVGHDAARRLGELVEALLS